ncbi:MAG: helix-turn-helix domain-containing protein [Desulfosudaceae bacterium]
MRLFDDMDYYEILEITPDASPSEIRQARQTLLMLYQNDPIVADSFFNEQEKRQLLAKIETAYEVLSDPDKKREYDRKHQPQAAVKGREDKDAASSGSRSEAVPPLLFEGEKPVADPIAKKIEGMVLPEEARKKSEEILTREKISGRDIQALRRAMNLSTAQVFEVTRIREVFLRAIEADRFEELPPKVYLKSFLENYARVLQLPPDIVARAYLNNMTSS